MTEAKRRLLPALSNATTAFTLLLLFALLCQPAPAGTGSATKSAKLPGWELHQIQALHNKVVLFITKDAIKMQSRSHAWAIICKAPLWNAICYDTSNKTICSVPYSWWKTHGFATSDWSFDLNPAPSNPQMSQDTICGHRVEVAEWTGAAPKINIMSQAQIGAERCSYALAVSSEINAPLPIVQCLGYFYDIPNLKRIPIQYCNAEGRGTHYWLNTVMCNETTIDPSIFNEPLDYKRVKTDNEIWVNSGDKTDINDMGQMMAPLSR
jgi:hypothetical protein